MNNRRPKGFPPGAQRVKIKVNPDTLPPVVCANCGWSVFIQANIIKRLDALHSPTGKPQPFVIPVLFCTRCETMFQSDNMVTVDEFEKLKEARVQ